MYRLNVTKDVWLESPTNRNDYDFVIVGLHPGYPKKRALFQFEDLTDPKSDSNRIRWAKMYVYFTYAHKASFQTVQVAPYISRELQIHQIKKQWSETEATQYNRLNDTPWGAQYVGLDDIDACARPLDTVRLNTGRPASFMEFDVTQAVRNWRAGEPNHGVIIWATNENVPGRDLRFASRTADESRHAFINVLSEY